MSQNKSITNVCESEKQMNSFISVQSIIRVEILWLINELFMRSKYMQNAMQDW